MNNEEFIVDILPTDDRSIHSGSTTNSAGTNTGSTLNAIVDQAFGQLLGQGNAANITEFQTALEQSFVAKKEGRRTEYEWRPYSYTSNTSDLGGGVTGAQASLYYRAKAIVGDILRLLDGLKPLNPAADLDNSEAIRSVVRTQVTELVAELGLAGGPRVQRIDHYFGRLLGDRFVIGRVDRVSGDLARLAVIFGFERDRINTVREEENFSNYLILQDYIVSLNNSWQTYKDQNDQRAYLGPQLVDISRALASVAESVRETYRLMNRHFLGADERQSVRLEFMRAQRFINSGDGPAQGIPREFTLPDGTIYRFNRDGSFRGISAIPEIITSEITTPELTTPETSAPETSAPETIELETEGPTIRPKSRVDIEQPIYAPNLKDPMTVAELLDWVMNFATQEGPRLVEAGGKIGVANSFEEKAFVLMVLVQAASAIEPKPNSALNRSGVVRAMQDIANQLSEVRHLASRIIPDRRLDDHLISS